MFKALADPTRRSLLDELFREDGQTLGALAERFEMSRFGVMKHLKQLEEAGLVVTKRRGRREGPLPEPRPDPARPRPVGEQVRRALGRRAQRPQNQIGESDGEGLRDLHQDHARAPLGGDHRPARSGASTSSAPRSPRTGRPARASRWPAGGFTLGEGENLEVDPPRRLVQTMVALWGDDVKAEGTSRITWEIEPVGDSCRLTVTHDQMREARTTSSTAAGR